MKKNLQTPKRSTLAIEQSCCNAFFRWGLPFAPQKPRVCFAPGADAGRLLRALVIIGVAFTPASTRGSRTPLATLGHSPIALFLQLPTEPGLLYRGVFFGVLKLDFSYGVFRAVVCVKRSQLSRNTPRQVHGAIRETDSPGLWAIVLGCGRVCWSGRHLGVSCLGFVRRRHR